MAKRSKSDAKAQALRESKTLNPRPELVRDQRFLNEDFFDPQDLAQVKYEMLRRVEKEGAPINDAASSFGFSRPSFYTAQENFAREGLAGLIPRKRGPKHRHKLTPEILDFVTQIQAQESPLSSPALLSRIQEKFGVTVHRRSLERALVAMKKKPR